MNTVHSVVWLATTALVISATSASAAPCESVESARASTAYQKIDAMLGEKNVADHLQAAGLSSEQAQARISQLSQTQIEQLAAQADLIQAGGTIQRNPGRLGPLDCMFKQIKTLFHNVYQLIFCWGDLK
jgi:hypothetical protein